jgi:hypothetical protein
MSEFHDRDLENLLGRAGGSFPDVNTAYVEVQGRVRQAKRRRALVVSSAACSLLLAVGLLAVNRSGGSGTVQPNDGGSELGPDGSRLQPDDTISITTESTIGTTEATVATTIEDSTTVTDPVVTTGATVATVPGNSQSPGNTGSNNSSHSTSPGTVPKTNPSAPSTSSPHDTDPVTTPTTAAAQTTQTFSGIGGSITVHLENGHLTLVSWQPAAGFNTEVKKNSGGHIEVRFESDHHRTDARVDLHEGTIVPDFSEDNT